MKHLENIRMLWSNKYYTIYYLSPLYQSNVKTLILDNPRWQWYSPRKRYSCSSPLSGVKERGVWIWKRHRCSLVLDWLISFTLYGLFVYWWTWHRYCKFEKVKVQNSVGLKYKFYMTILKVSSFCRGNKIGQQVYLWRKEQQGGTRSHHHYFVTWLFWQILIS